MAQPPTAVVGFALVAPLLTALLAAPREVAIVGAFAVALVMLSALWRDNLGELVYIYRICLVAAAGVLAALVGRDRERFAVLSSVAEITDGTRSLEETVAGLHDIVVPDVADICIVDAVSGGELQRLAVRAAAGHAGAAALAARPPATVDSLGDPEHPQLLKTIDDAVLRKIALDEDDFLTLRGLRATSAMVVPLRAGSGR